LTQFVQDQSPFVHLQNGLVHPRVSGAAILAAAPHNLPHFLGVERGYDRVLGDDLGQADGAREDAHDARRFRLSPAYIR
jgi:hypothetical protein